MYVPPLYLQLYRISMEVKVSTVEHLLASLYIAGIDDAIIEIDNENAKLWTVRQKIF